MEEKYKTISEQEALTIAKENGLEKEIQDCLNDGLTPEEALIEWDID